MQVDRRLRLGERPGPRIALVWLLMCVILCLGSLGRIRGMEFPDPDDALRLVEVRDLLAGQGWFDLHQYRINPPGGTLMHWSRLVDIPLALMISLLAPLLGQPLAEQVTLVLVPLLTLAAILTVIGRLAWRLFDVETATYSCLAVGLAPTLVFQLQPMRIDHHGWQILAVAVALAALAGRQAWRGGALAGLALAAGLSISIELLPLAAAFGGICALRWLRGHDERWWLAGYMQALALGLAAIFFATRGLADLGPHCDAVSPAHLGFFLIIAAAVTLLAAAPRLPRGGLVVLLALAGGAAIAFLGATSPACLKPPFAGLDPLVREFWYERVLEGQPFWRLEQLTAVPVLLQLLAGMAASVALWQRSRDWLRQWWGDYSLLLGAAIALSLLVWRSSAFAAVIAAIPIGWLTGRLLARLRHVTRPGQKLASAAMIALVLMPSAPVVLARRALPVGGNEITTLRTSQCRVDEQARKLAGLAPATIFAPLDIGPAILVSTGHSVVATGHHRAERAMHDVIAAFSGSPDAARQIIARHRATYLAMCTDLVEAQVYAMDRPGSFAAALIKGRAPDWLEPVPIPGPRQFRLWRVRPAAPPVRPE